MARRRATEPAAVVPAGGAATASRPRVSARQLAGAAGDRGARRRRSRSPPLPAKPTTTASPVGIGAGPSRRCRPRAPGRAAGDPPTSTMTSMCRPPNCASMTLRRSRPMPRRATLLVRGELHVVGPQPSDLVVAGRHGRRPPLTGCPADGPATPSRRSSSQPVRHADERRRRTRWPGSSNTSLRRAELLDPAGPHDRQSVAERQRLALVVGDEDRGEAEPGVQLVQLGPHLVAQPRVEVAQRLVEQHQVGSGHQAAGQRHALLLAAAELRRIAVEQVLRSRPVAAVSSTQLRDCSRRIRRARSG